MASPCPRASKDTQRKGTFPKEECWGAVLRMDSSFGRVMPKLVYKRLKAGTGATAFLPPQPPLCSRLWFRRSGSGCMPHHLFGTEHCTLSGRGCLLQSAYSLGCEVILFPSLSQENIRAACPCQLNSSPRESRSMYLLNPPSLTSYLQTSPSSHVQ